MAHLGINPAISGGDEAGNFTVCLDVWSYAELMNKFGGYTGFGPFLEFLANSTRAFSNTQEDENINRNIAHGELCGWQSLDSQGSQACGVKINFSMCI